MKKNVALAFIILSLGLSGCSTYQTPGGRTNMADPSFCRSADGLCPLLIGAVVLGAGALAVK